MFIIGIALIVIAGLLIIKFGKDIVALKESKTYTESQRDYLDYKIPKKSTMVITAVLCAIFVCSGIALMNAGAKTESFKRFQKQLESEYDGGLQRTITVIDKDGDVLKEYSGKMDIKETDGDKLVFVIEGKKYIIYNNIFNTIFVEEK